MPHRLLPVALALVAAILLVQAPAALAAGAYTSGTAGHDFGWPQCGLSLPSGAFVVAEVNHGRPFDQNPCLATEFAAAGTPSVYLNTGYDPVYTDSAHTTADCATKGLAVSGDTAHQQAWAAGCSEAQKSMAYAASQGAGSPVAWWLDVETANSWSTSDLTLNQATLQGLSDTIRAASTAPVGVYSTASQWQAIVGGNPVGGLAANWVATGAGTQKRARTFCGSSFTGAPVWLVQWTARSFDNDFAC